jgi:hypothetical protein
MNQVGPMIRPVVRLIWVDEQVEGSRSIAARCRDNPHGAAGLPSMDLVSSIDP